MKYHIGDIVDWKVIGSGARGRVLGTLRCTVTAVDSFEVVLKPLDIGECKDIIGTEFDDDQWQEIAMDDYRFCEPELDNLTLVRGVRTVEFVFRVETNASEGELDDFLCNASEMVSEMVFSSHLESAYYTMTYQPQGSHWREVDLINSDASSEQGRTT